MISMVNFTSFVLSWLIYFQISLLGLWNKCWWNKNSLNSFYILTIIWNHNIYFLSIQLIWWSPPMEMEMEKSAFLILLLKYELHPKHLWRHTQTKVWPINYLSLLTNWPQNKYHEAKYKHVFIFILTLDKKDFYCVISLDFSYLKKKHYYKRLQRKFKF